MKAKPSSGLKPVDSESGKRYAVPGPKSMAIFDREAEVMAPGLQSIALFSRIVVDRAKGCVITDVDGKDYLDFVAGIGVGSLGHCHPHYLKRLKEQLDHVTFGSFTTETRARFLEILGGMLPEGITHVQMFSGGAEAVEAAFRLAKSVTKRFEFVGFWGGFHGKTAGVIGLLSGEYRNHQGPFPPGSLLSPYASCYRCPWKLEYPSCGLACAEHLRNVIKHESQSEVAAIVMEPMQGTAGNVIPPDDFVAAAREIADEAGALLIADEMLTGMGRTGRMWAMDHYDVKPDIVTFGKGIGGGFPLSGVASSLERMNAKPFGMPSGSSSSFGGNPLAAAAGLATVETILAEKLVENSAKVGAVLLDALKALQNKYRFIGDVRGKGLMIGMDMVADRKTKEPLDKSVTRALFHEALDRGLVTMSYSSVIRINPPLVITEEEALKGVDILDQSFCAIARRFGLD
ncbi:MAG TPA: aspartate aminotransferase family protein [Candidatus Bathyarchaeia archaeon]|nr:aspartate aminotransferase family protein [Candidatus Bathyarchaeia archaeon]